MSCEGQNEDVQERSSIEGAKLVGEGLVRMGASLERRLQIDEVLVSHGVQLEIPELDLAWEIVVAEWKRREQDEFMDDLRGVVATELARVAMIRERYRTEVPSADTRVLDEARALDDPGERAFAVAYAVAACAFLGPEADPGTLRRFFYEYKNGIDPSTRDFPKRYLIKRGDRFGYVHVWNVYDDDLLAPWRYCHLEGPPRDGGPLFASLPVSLVV